MPFGEKCEQCLAREFTLTAHQVYARGAMGVARPGKCSGIDSFAPHHAHAGAPILVDIETIDFDVIVNTARQR